MSFSPGAWFKGFNGCQVLPQWLRKRYRVAEVWGSSLPRGTAFFCSHCSFLCLSFGGQCTLKGFPPFSLTPFARRNRKGQGRWQKWDKKLKSLFKLVLNKGKTTKGKRQKHKKGKLRVIKRKMTNQNKGKSKKGSQINPRRRPRPADNCFNYKNIFV